MRLVTCTVQLLQYLVPDLPAPHSGDRVVEAFLQFSPLPLPCVRHHLHTSHTHTPYRQKYMLSSMRLIIQLHQASFALHDGIQVGLCFNLILSSSGYGVWGAVCLKTHISADV